MANILKVSRQVDQYADATLTSALIQTIFAAVLKTNINGVAAFDGLMTNGDSGTLNLGAYATAKGEWYDGAQIDLTQHGRIAQLFPNDELTFTEAKQPGQQYDQFMGWLMREIAAGCGTTYESATGDYRGATYSSIRMGGAIEWQTVIRTRDNIIIPFCNIGKNNWMDEAVTTGRLEFPGGLDAYLANREAAQRGVWSGPVQPQADDFKAARSQEVLKGIQATTLAEISASYGRDWDDDMRQRAEENRLADELKLPRPWAPVTMLETPAGQELALNPPEPAAPAGGKPASPGKKPSAAVVEDVVDLDVALEEELEESITEDGDD
jgi:capsid protein